MGFAENSSDSTGRLGNVTSVTAFIGLLVDPSMRMITVGQISVSVNPDTANLCHRLIASLMHVDDAAVAVDAQFR
jgi:hypothetical protein